MDKRRHRSIYQVLSFGLALAIFCMSMPLLCFAEGEQSAAPNDEQTAAPSDEQSTVPSDEQIVAPSDEQSTVPSDEQSTVPSDEQTAAPSDEQTVAPSSEQSAAPNDEQTAASSGEETLQTSSEQTSVISNEAPAEASDVFVIEGNKITGFNTAYLNTLAKNADGNYALGDVVIPKEVTQVGGNTTYLENSANIAIDTLSFEAGAAVTLVGKHAFQGVQIATIDFTNASLLSTIGGQAFMSCGTTKIIWSPAGALTTIGSNAFLGNAITGACFTIPEGVSKIEGAAFDGIDVDVLVFPSSISSLAKATFQGVTAEWCVFNFAANGTTLPNGSSNNRVSIANTLVKDKASYDYVMKMSGGEEYLKPTYEMTLTFKGSDDGTGNAITKQVLYNRPIQWVKNADGLSWSVDAAYTMPALSAGNERWVVDSVRNNAILGTSLVLFDHLDQVHYAPRTYEYLWFGEYQQTQLCSYETAFHKADPDSIAARDALIAQTEATGKEVFFRELNDTQGRWYTVDPILWKIFATQDNGDGTTSYALLSEHTLAVAQIDAAQDAASFVDTDLWKDWFVGEFNPTAFDQPAFTDDIFVDNGFTKTQREWFKVATSVPSYFDMFGSNFPNAEDRVATFTDYCVSIIYFGRNTGSRLGDLCLREVAGSTGNHYNYTVQSDGGYGGTMQAVIMGVRPMAIITIDSRYNVLENAGTFADPYVIGTVSHTATYCTDPATVLDTEEIVDGLTATKPASPSRVGYTLAGWYTSPDGGTTLSTDPYEFTTAVTGDITLYAKWAKARTGSTGGTEAPVYFDILLGQSGKGAITPAGNEGRLSVKKLESQTVCFTPSAGYQVSEVLIDGIPQGAISSYTFLGVACEHSVFVTFSPVNAHVNPQTGVDVETIGFWAEILAYCKQLIQ